MAKLSQRSRRRLETCHPEIIRWCGYLITEVDFTIICGYRNKEKQTEAFRLRRSSKRWPYSKHNELPSKAIDIAPYPVDWNDKARFAFFAGYAIRVAHEMKIELRWGGDWDRDTFTTDHTLIDMPHFEIILKTI